MRSDPTPRPIRQGAVTAELTVAALALMNLGVFGLTVSVILRSEPPESARPSALALGLTVIIVLLQAVVLRWRTPRPEASFIGGTALYLSGMLLMRSDLVMVIPSYVVLVFSYASQRPRCRQLLLLGGALILVTTAIIGNDMVHRPAITEQLRSQYIAGTAPIAFFTMITVVAAGSWYGTLRRKPRMEHSNADLVEREQEARLQTALVMERNHMARELHDVAAHHLTTILVQSKALRRKSDLNSDEAREALDVIAAESEHAVRNMSAIVGILRENSETGELPQLSKLPELLASLAKHDADVQVSIEGELDTVGPQASLTCFRIVQESVTNARKHAPGAEISVQIRRSLRQLTAEITNRPPPVGTEALGAPGGYGIVGMQERVALLGGTLRSGPNADGGWTTSATIPIEAERNPL